MPIGVRVTLRRDRMYEFMERFIRIALPRIRDFKGVNGKLDGRGNYTVGVTEQIIFPEINIDNVTKMTPPTSRSSSSQPSATGNRRMARRPRVVSSISRPSR